MFEEIVKMICPICKEERDFHRVIEAHETRGSGPPIVGVRLPTFTRAIPQPVGYCSVCKIVVYIGPSLEEVECEVKKKELERKSAEYERYADGLKGLFSSGKK